MAKRESSTELSSLASRILQLDMAPPETSSVAAGAYNQLLRDAQRLAGSVLSQDETPIRKLAKTFRGMADSLRRN